MKYGSAETLSFVTHEAIALRAVIVLMLAVLRSAWHSLAKIGKGFSRA